MGEVKIGNNPVKLRITQRPDISVSKHLINGKQIRLRPICNSLFGTAL